MDGTDRIDLAVKNVMIQNGFHWLGIGSGEYEKENHCKFETSH
jgi:hypothetical protein